MHYLKLTLLLLFSLSIKAQNVYKTPSGKKYHILTCRMAENVSEEITLEQAGEIGLLPCKICNPPVTSSANSLADKKASGESSTVQCRGLTKAGTRCKHRTRIANGYCFQHNPEK